MQDFNCTKNLNKKINFEKNFSNKKKINQFNLVMQDHVLCCKTLMHTKIKQKCMTYEEKL